MTDHVPIVRARSGCGPRTRKAHLRIKARLGQRITHLPQPGGPPVTADHFADPDAFRNALLTAIAMARGVLLGDAFAVDSILDADDLKSTAAALVDLTARLLMTLPHEQVLPVLAGAARPGSAHRRRPRSRRGEAVSDIPDPELFRRAREQKLRTASGPISPDTLVPECLRGLIRADHDDPDVSGNAQPTPYPEA